MSSKDQYLVWMDMEMSGLNPETDRILEMATIITDGRLNIVAEGPEIVVHQPDSVLDAMDEWNRTHHGGSGLTDKVRRSHVHEAEAEEMTLQFIGRHCARRAIPLAGNSVHQDRRFLAKYMPRLNEYLHYRIVDVSSVKELAKRWYPEAVIDAPQKQSAHRALEDIKDSISELRYYKRRIFLP